MSARYITTTLPYVNADPHVGFALEIIQADAFARVERLKGNEVVFNTGSDEHGVKIYEKAREAGEEPQAYVDRYAKKFENLRAALNLSYDRFIRTTDPKHIHAAQTFWKRCAAAGDIYKKAYQIAYCVGCELEKTDSELVEGRCAIHPNLEIQRLDEENYFFRFSNYAEKLTALYAAHPSFMVPAFRINEFTSLVEREGLQDFSISRLAEKMPWGVPVPGDDTQVMYVWFDALVSYISTIGWPDNEQEFSTYWPVTQFAGKDQVRQQAAMWQAMLMSAGLPASKQIFIHGFLNSGGQKMSKSLGNVIDPFEYVERYGTDALRYFLLRHCHPFEDSDFTRERFEEAYTAHLTNGIGNLVARVMKLCEDNLPAPIPEPPHTRDADEVFQAVEHFSFNAAMDVIFALVAAADERITREEPYKVVKTDRAQGEEMLRALAAEVWTIGKLLEPFMPETSAKIIEAVRANKKPENLFPRLEK